MKWRRKIVWPTHDAAGNKISDVAEEADDETSDVAEEADDETSDTAERADDKTSDVAERADVGASDVAEEANEASDISDASEETDDKASDVSEEGEKTQKQKSGRVWKKVTDVAGGAASATRGARKKVIGVAGGASSAVVSGASSAVSSAGSVVSGASSAVSGAGSAVDNASGFVADVSVMAGKKVIGVAGGAASATRGAGREVLDVAAAAGSTVASSSVVCGAGSAVGSASGFVAERSSDAWEKVGDTAEAAALRTRIIGEFAAVKAVEARRMLSETSRELIEELRRVGERLREDPQELARVVAVSSKAKIVDLGAGAATGTVTLGKHASKRLTEMSILLAEASRQGFAHVQSVADMNTAKAVASSAVSAFEAVEGAFPEFNELSSSMRYKMATAGLRGDWRPVDVSTQFYESSVPFPVRNLGEDAVQVFLKGKHASHIESVANAPSKVMDTANIVWERGSDNIARGAANMTPFELAQVNAKNLLHAAGIVGMEALENAVKAGCVGMALEGVVSLGENMIYVYKGEKTREEALKSVGKDMLKKGAASAIGGFGISLAVALGAGPALAAAAPALVTVGGGLFVISTYKRIKTAVDSDGHPEEQSDGLAEISDGFAEIRSPELKQLGPGSDSLEELAPERALAV